MNKKTIAFCLAFWLLLPNLILAATNKPLENTEFQVFKAQTELKFDGAKDSQQKDLQLLQQQLETQNKQIDGFDKRISDINFYLAIYAILATIVAIAVSVLALFTAGIKAKESAEIWFNENENNLLKRINELKARLEKHAFDATVKISTITQEVGEKAELQIQDLQKKMNTGSSSSTSNTTPELQAVANELKDKPESQYTFDDWNTRAFAAYTENKLALAAEYWGYAAMVSDATNTNAAQAIFNKGLALHEQGNIDAAMTCYDDVIERFGNSTETALQVQIAKALVNKGATLGEQSKYDEAMTCYDEVIKRFATSTETALQAAVAQTLANKGTTLNNQYKYEAAIACYDLVIKRFSNTTKADLQEPVSHALNGKGFSQLNLAKQTWESVPERTNLLNSALNLFEQAKVKSSDIAIVLGNVAYALWLLGRNDEAIPPLREALTLGGEKLRDAELKDTETHPIESVDAGFRDLVNKIWEEVKPR